MGSKLAIPRVTPLCPWKELGEIPSLHSDRVKKVKLKFKAFKKRIMFKKPTHAIE